MNQSLARAAAQKGSDAMRHSRDRQKAPMADSTPAKTIHETVIYLPSAKSVTAAKSATIKKSTSIDLMTTRRFFIADSL